MSRVYKPLDHFLKRANRNKFDNTTNSLFINSIDYNIKEASELINYKKRKIIYPYSVVKFINSTKTKIQINFPTPPKKPIIIPPIPTKKSMAQYIPNIYDQGQLGSCTANAFCQSYRIQEKIKFKTVNFEPSRLFFYYCERLVEGDINVDGGADVIDGENYAKLNGVCAESLYPYIISKFTVQPSIQAVADAKNHKITSYSRLNTIQDIK